MIKHKALAYILRLKCDAMEVLVFDHRDFPDVGTQIPAGTVEYGEDEKDGLFREVAEESGLMSGQLRYLAYVGESPYGKGVVRHYYLLTPAVELPDNWPHIVAGNGADKGLTFDYRWATVTAIELAGGQGELLAGAAAKFTSLQSKRNT